MQMQSYKLVCVGLLGLVVASEVLAQASRVSYGRITAVRQVNIENQGASRTGAAVGGLAGIASGSGQSNSNRALRAIGGAAVGSRVGAAAGSTTGFEYTILIDGTTSFTMVTEKAGLRVQDCVSVERGQFNNIRLAPDERCDAAVAAATAATAAAAPVPAAAASAADACATATQQVLDAATDEEFDRAERRMRLLCD